MQEAVMLCRSIVFVMAVAGVTCGATAQAPPGATAQPPAKPPVARKLTLTAQEVTLARPVDIVVAGAKRSLRNLTEFRVTSSDPLPVRALDPVLVVGGTRVTDYRYENGDRTLVFSMYEPAKVAADAPMEAYLQYGDDQASRMTLPALRRAEIKRVRR
jgi:hypothetical protein